MLLTITILFPLFLQALTKPTATPIRRAQCSNPLVRKEWKSFTVPQRTAYFNAFKCLKTKPHDPSLSPNPPIPGVPVDPSASLYDDIVYLHAALVEKIHFSGIFLPWHRWYVNTVEQLLRSECNYQGPMSYWDWTEDAADGVQESSVFGSNSQAGMGSLGQASNNFVVTDGAWVSQTLAYPSPHTIKRNFTVTPYREGQMAPPYLVTKPNANVNRLVARGEVNRVVNDYRGDFVGFYNKFDEVEGFHSGLHFSIGGDMADPSWSPNDPLFFLHHGMLDRIWALWQDRHPSNKNAFSGGSTWAVQSLQQFQTYGPSGMPPNLGTTAAIPNIGFGDSVTVADVLDTEGGYVCYVYA
ncbi:hypothetical protein BDV98DRAFT_536582 [Pterulicium gracile]|uniref:Tyrosinase copper-binding domain-containing protein n=1 Tax=Pterulicium gracile TaxID=1884261 RepID=A0A5C3Q2X4_9AGAR|nr:hypothetical protein BDV98DRAFT_536582 [Pterula gracilis]